MTCSIFSVNITHQCDWPNVELLSSCHRMRGLSISGDMASAPDVYNMLIERGTEITFKPQIESVSFVGLERERPLYISARPRYTVQTERYITLTDMSEITGLNINLYGRLGDTSVKSLCKCFLTENMLA